MYRDNTLIPSEAVRLLALGFLAEEDCGYADLASAVRQFTSRVVGPSLELVAAPLELLKVEGLIEQAAEGENARLTITSAGQEEMVRLLSAGVRAPTIGDDPELSALMAIGLEQGSVSSANIARDRP